MNYLTVILAAVTAIAANAQTTNTSTGAPAPATLVAAPIDAQHRLSANASNAPPVRETPSPVNDLALSEAASHLWIKEPKVDEIKWGKLTLGGIAVEAVKSRNPLQLLNPAAPAQYDTWEDNVVRDPVTGHPAGLKLFSLSF